MKRKGSRYSYSADDYTDLSDVFEALYAYCRTRRTKIKRQSYTPVLAKVLTITV